MKKYRNIFSLLLVVVMLFTACGTAEKAEEPVAAPEATEEAVSEEPASEYAGMGDGKTLTYWSCWNETEAQAEVLKRTIERFEAETGYTVEVQWLGRDVNKTAGMSIEAGEKIDIYDADAALLAPENAMDIDELAEKYGLKDEILPAYAAWQSEVSPAGDGHWYAVPYQPFVTGIYYNKAIFREAGVEAVPTTWDEFLAACEKIKAAGYDPMTVDDAYVSLLYMQQLGLCMGNEDACALGTSTGEAWKNEIVKDVMTKWQEFAELGYFSSTVGGNQYPAAQNGELALGTAAMYYNASWLPNEVSPITGKDFEWGIMYMPAMNDNDYRIPQVGCCEVAVSPKSEDPDGAVLLLKYMTDAETCQDMADNAMCLPVVAGVESPGALKDLDGMMAESVGAFRYMVWSATVSSEVSTLSDTYFHQLIGGNCTAEEFIQHMVDGK